jgi:hypothetical protein
MHEKAGVEQRGGVTHTLAHRRRSSKFGPEEVRSILIEQAPQRLPIKQAPGPRACPPAFLGQPVDRTS